MDYRKSLPMLAVTLGLAAGLNTAANADDIFALNEVTGNGTQIAEGEHACGAGACGKDENGEHKCGAGKDEAKDDHACGAAACGKDASDDKTDHACGAAVCGAPAPKN
jgi:hypothetical protein